MSILDELEWRGLVADCTDLENLRHRVGANSIVLYAGFDPTADSLHVGNLVPLLALRRFQLAGHRPIALAGGATGLIGDPSGKSAERQLLTRERLDHNIACVKEQLRRLLDFESADAPAQLLDNAEWIAPMSYLEFLREVGKYLTVNMMVAKESVRARMEDRESGISYTEFSYMLLQAYDFYHLHRTRECELQIGGSDQWGNITAGIDLIRKKHDADDAVSSKAFGLTLPLITNADGSKFGKTVAGAVWLNPARTSIYRFYQFWIRTDDRDVIRYLKYFTFLTREEIDELEAAHQSKPEARTAHKALARAVTDLIHGPDATQEAIRASEILFGGELTGISQATLEEIVGEVPTKGWSRSDFLGEGIPLVEVLAQSGLCPSKGQARKDVEGGGIYVNNIRQSDPQRRITVGDDAWFQFDKYLLLRKGKRNYMVIVLESPKS